jgi:hypothetical protein
MNISTEGRGLTSLIQTEINDVISPVIMIRDDNAGFFEYHSLRPDKIRLLAVAHQKRRPFYWRGRR